MPNLCTGNLLAKGRKNILGGRCPVRYCIVGALRRRCFPWGNNRADTIRPYADGAAESPSGYFVAFVGAAISRPPTWQIFEQNHIGRTGVPMLQIHHVSAYFCRISFTNIKHCIVGALRRRCFHMGKTTGRLIAVELWSDHPRRSFNFDSLRGAPPYTVCTAELPPQKLMKF